METRVARVSLRKDRRIAATGLATALLLNVCPALAQQLPPDPNPNAPAPSQAAPVPPEARAAGDPKSGVLKPPDIDPNMSKHVPDVDPGMTQPPTAKTAPPAEETPGKVQPK